jgi:hypothetical protein
MHKLSKKPTDFAVSVPSQKHSCTYQPAIPQDQKEWRSWIHPKGFIEAFVGQSNLSEDKHSAFKTI